MKKRKVQMYQCLTFFKSDISTVVQLFQENLQDVEILIDSHAITDVAQLELFEPVYQATSLIARGSVPAQTGEDVRSHGERLHIELKLLKTVALLFVWNNVGQGDPEVLVHIRKLLMRCHNRNHGALTKLRGMLIMIMAIPPIVMLGVVFRQSPIIFNMQMFLVIGICILLVPALLFLIVYFGRVFHVETTIFVLPGGMRTAHIYGRREAVSRLLITMVLGIVIEGCLLFVLPTFWSEIVKWVQ